MKSLGFSLSQNGMFLSLQTIAVFLSLIVTLQCAHAQPLEDRVDALAKQMVEGDP